MQKSRRLIVGAARDFSSKKTEKLFDLAVLGHAVAEHIALLNAPGVLLHPFGLDTAFTQRGLAVVHLGAAGFAADRLRARGVARMRRRPHGANDGEAAAATTSPTAKAAATFLKSIIKFLRRIDALARRDGTSVRQRQMPQRGLALHAAHCSDTQLSHVPHKRRLVTNSFL
jgi:hypothetical protein